MATNSSNNPNPQIKPAYRRLSMSNALIRAAQSLTLPEKRLIALAVSQLTKDISKTEYLQSPLLTITAVEMSKVFSIDASDARRDLQAAANKLFDRVISFKDFSDASVRMRWVPSIAKYTNGKVQIRLFDDLLPHLLELREKFTTYKLAEVGSINSIYAWRLFELLKSWANAPYNPQIPLTDIYFQLETPNSYGSDFGQFRVKILEPALKSIINNTDLIVSYDLVKEGRKVVALSFFIRSKKAEKAKRDKYKSIQTSTRKIKNDN